MRFLLCFVLLLSSVSGLVLSQLGGSLTRELSKESLLHLAELVPDLTFFDSEGRETRTFEHSNPIYYVGSTPSAWWVWDPIRDDFARTVVLEDGSEVFMRSISTSPRAFVVRGLLSKAECEEMIAEAEPNMTRSFMQHPDGEVFYDNSRNSDQAWVEDKRGDESRASFKHRRRIFDLLRLKQELELDEQLQVTRYQLGQHYHSHLDSHNELSRQNRFVSTVTILQKAEEGGQLAFPRAHGREISGWDACEGAVTNVDAGDVVFFYVLDAPDHMHGKVDPNALHISCDVTKGTKWSAVKFIHNLPNKWREWDRFIGAKR